MGAVQSPLEPRPKAELSIFLPEQEATRQQEPPLGMSVVAAIFQRLQDHLSFCHLMSLPGKPQLIGVGTNEHGCIGPV